jgi:hypothetical protein
MSLFNWFSRKPAVLTPEYPADSGMVTAATPTPALAPVGQAAASRKIERLAHREFLYSVVRDAMIRAGVLAASYKFKVLSLDAHGRQYLIMMDIDKQAMDAIASLSEIETAMTQAAKARHDLLVTAVYWRATEQVTTGVQPSPVASAPLSRGPSETLLDDEVAAFKRAVASGVPAKPSAVGHSVTSGRRHPAPTEEFQDTQIVPSDANGSPLGGTQYGELN